MTSTCTQGQPGHTNHNPTGHARRRRLAAVAAAVTIATGACSAKANGNKAALVTEPKRPETSVTQTIAPSVASSSAITSPPSFAQVYANDSSGVIRIEGTSCNGGDVGTGFLIAPDLVATVAHVVSGATTIALRTNVATHVGTVVGVDPARDLALVRSSSTFSGHVFTLPSTTPQVGTPVGAIGYPEGLPLTFTQGAVSGLDRSVDIAGTHRVGLIQTDAAVNAGNSGGPLLTTAGDVIGLVDAGDPQASGISFAVSSQTARPLFAAWQASPQPVPPSPSCTYPVGPSSEPGTVTSQVPGSYSQAIVSTLSTYFAAINKADWHTAWQQFTPAEQQVVTETGLARGDRSTFDFNMSLVALQPGVAGDTAVATVTFTSVQDFADGPNGDPCDNWRLNYSMRDIGGGWLIDAVNAQAGSPSHTSC